MGKFARGLALQQLGQGLTAAGSTFAQSLLAAKKDKEEQAYRGVNVDLMKQQIAKGSQEAEISKQNAQAEAEVAAIIQKVQTDPAYKEAFTKQLVDIGKKQEGDLGTRYQSQTWEETGETEQQPTQPEAQQQPESLAKKTLGALRKYETSKSPVVQETVKRYREEVEKEEGRDYGKYIVELQNAGILTPEEKELLEDRKREKDLQAKKDLEAYKVGIKPTTAGGKEQERKSTTGAAADVSGLGFGLGHLDTLKKLVTSGDVNIFNTSLPMGVGGFTNPELINAIDNLTEFHGRKQSGAVISPKEWDNFKKQILNPRFLATEEGRKVAGEQLDNFIGRYYAQGELITKNEKWYEDYLSSKKRGIEKIGGKKKKSSFDELWGD